MKQFAELFNQLDQTNKTSEKVRILKEYFKIAPDKDKLWVLALFTHKRPRRQIRPSLLKEWISEVANIPLWLFSESYNVVGDLAETFSLLLPPPKTEQDRALSWWIEFLVALGNEDDAVKKEKVLLAWQSMTQQEVFVFTKLMTGSFRIGVSQSLVVRAVSEVTGVDKSVVAHRIMGHWHPDSTTFQKLILEESSEDNLSRPYPFYLAYPLESPLESLGHPQDWQAEWKWDGIRGQIIVRENSVFIWSRGEELVTDKFPELVSFAQNIPNGTVLDGEILPFKDNKPLPFGILQTRIGRKNISKSNLKEAPISFMAYDVLEWKGEDYRQRPLSERRKVLEQMQEELAPGHDNFLISKLVKFAQWDDLIEIRGKSREMFAEGLMLKSLSSDYKVGRKRGDWWKWKIDPLTIDGVLIYAQKGSGRRADLYTDYTFGLWENDQLIPFAKAYSGLTDEEIRKVDAYVKRNTVEKFGPVRTVKPKLVFEIAFEGIQKSTRHKSGVALRFPRIMRWRHDKKIEDANCLEELKGILNLYNGA